MTTQRSGDFHNFGKAVSMEDSKVLKPRTLYWEWLFLSEHSWLKSVLADCSYVGGFPSCMPRLEFYENAPKSSQGGRVSKLVLNPLPEKLSTEWVYKAGEILALMQGFGVGDLHVENLALGIDECGRFICGPLDVECLFHECKLPSDTLLLPNRYFVKPKLSGYGILFDILRKQENRHLVTQFLMGYHDFTTFLTDHRNTISNALIAQLRGKHFPIRTIFRASACYAQFLKLGHLPADEFPLLASEDEQLMRGDVPYYFHYIENSEILYFSAPHYPALAKIPTDEIAQALAPVSLFENFMADESRLCIGLLQIALYLDGGFHETIEGPISTRYDRQRVTCTLQTGDTLECERLANFVS